MIKELFKEKNTVVMIPNTNLIFRKYDETLEHYKELSLYKEETTIIDKIDIEDLPIDWYIEKLKDSLYWDDVLLEEEDIKNFFLDLLSKGKMVKTKLRFIKTIEVGKG